MARSLLAPMTAVFAALVSTMAWAGPRDDALAAIAAEDFKAAKKALGILDDHLGLKKKLVRPEVLRRRYLTEALYHETRGKKDDVLAALRQACVVHPGSEPDESIIGDGAMVDMFYAVCSEVEQRPEVDLVSLKLPDAPVRIDGAVPGEEYPVREGRHLVQVECEDGTWSTRWSELSRAENWASSCPDGAVASAAPDAPDDLVDAVMPGFLMGGDDGDLDSEDLDSEDLDSEDLDSEDLASDEPASDEPASDEPASDEPASDEPASDEPASEDQEAAAGAADAGPEDPEAAGPEDPEAAGPEDPEAAGPEDPEAAGAEPPAGSTAAAAGAADKVRLVVKCAPSPCTVKIDGKEIGKSPLITRVELGEHDFSLKAGPNSITRKLMLAADDTTLTVVWDHEKGEWNLGTPGSMH